MRRPYKLPVAEARPELKDIKPKISRVVIILLKLFTWLYLFLYFGIHKTTLREQRIVFEAFRRAMAGESRLMIAFRHPNGGEPQLLTVFFLFKLRKLAAKLGIYFARKPHSVFVYGFEVVRWGGWAARYIMPGVGAMPVYHAKISSKSLEMIYNAIVNGPYPLAIAPEGKISYTADTVPQLESGVIRMGFHAAQRLASSGSKIPVEVLPLSVHFRFGYWGHVTLEWLLRKIEKTCGFKPDKKLPFDKRAGRCRDRILSLNEKRYGIEADPSGDFEPRLETVVYAALENAERILGIKGEGEVPTRMHKANQVYWDQLFVPGVETMRGKSRLDRGILDLRAGEAWYAGRHVELVELSWYFRLPLPADDSALHAKVEYAQNLWDFANRTMGGAIKNRLNILPRRVILQAAPVLNLSERLKDFKADKKAATAAALGDLEKAYLDCIAEASCIKDHYDEKHG